MADLTKDEARQELCRRATSAFRFNDPVGFALGAFLSAPPEVLAAAMGGKAVYIASSPRERRSPCIVLPPSEVDGEGK